MKPARFTYHAPATVEEAVSVLHEHAEEAKVLAGGQSLVPMLALRLARFEHLVDLNRLGELSGISDDGNWLTIGAMTRQAAVERSAEVEAAAPLLHRAMPEIAHFQIRNRGTVGGSMAHGDPAAELPAVALALGAEIEVRGRRGSRAIPASEFYVSVFQTALAPDEVVVAVRFPHWDGTSGFALEEMAWRSGDFAVAGAACAVGLRTSGHVNRVGIALMGMGPTPLRAAATEASLLHAEPGDIDLPAVARMAVGESSPADDVHASADYRRRVGALLVERALSAALEEALHG